MEPGSSVAEAKHVVGKIKEKSLCGGKLSYEIRILLELLCSLSPTHYRSKSARRDFLRLFLPLLYTTLNLLAYLPLKSPQDYTGTARAWKGVLWLRLDYLVGQIDLQTAIVYAIWIAIGTLTMLLGVLIVQLAVRKRPSERLKEWFELGMGGLYLLFPVPTVHFLMADCVNEQSTVFPAVSLLPALSAVCLLLLVFLVLLRHIAALAALCHPKYWRPGTGSSLSTPLCPLLSLLLSSFLYLTVPALSVYLYYGLFSLLHSLLAGVYFGTLPLYHETANLTHICCHLALAWGGIAQIIGQLIGSDSVAVMLLIIVTPALIYVLCASWKALYWNMLSDCSEDCDLPQSRNSVTLIVRAAIIQGNTETILHTFHRLRQGSSRQLGWIGVLQATYSLQVKGDERLARLQLAQRKGVKAGWVDTYLRFKLWQSLQSSSLEEVAYLHFLRSEAQVHSTDEGLCRDLSEFWSEVASQDPKRSKINNLMDRIAMQISATKLLYEEMLAISPDNTALLDSYTAFLRDILLQPEKAVKWVTKGRIIRETQFRQTDSEISYGQEGTGILVVDMSSEDPGKVLYCNQEAVDLLHYDHFTLSSLKFFALLPQPYASVHSGYFRRFSSLRTTVKLQHPQVLPLVTASGDIVEVTTKVAITSVGGAVLLVLGFRQANTQREIALVTTEGLITATSQGFSPLLGAKPVSLVGESLYTLCPKLLLAGNTEEIVRVSADPLIFGSLCSVQYRGKAVRMALLYAGNMRTLAEAKRRSSVEKALTFINSGQMSVDKQEMASSLSRLKDRPRDKGTSGGKLSWSITSASNGREWLVKGSIKQGLNRTYGILGSAVGLIALLLVVWTVAIVLYLLTVTKGVIEDSVAIELAERIVHTTRVAGQGRFLDLTNAGFFPAYMTTDVKNVVYQSVVALAAIEQTVWGTLQTFPEGPFKDLVLESQVLTWELSGGVPRSHSRNLVNAMQVFLDHSRQMLDLPISNLSIHNPSVFFLVRNGLQGELIKALSLSLSLFTDVERNSIEANVSSILYLLIAVFLSLGIVLAISIPVIVRLQLYVTKVSAIFMSLPVAKCLENKRVVVDRLRYRFGVEMEYGIESPKKREREYVIYRPISLLILLAIGFVSLSIALYLGLYFDGIAALVDYVRVLPGEMQSYAQRFAEMIDLWTWTMEAIFSTSTWSLTLAVPSYSPQLSPSQVIHQTSASFSQVSQKLFEMLQQGYLPYSSADLHILMYASNYTTPLLQKGLKPGFLAYSYDIRQCAEYRGVSDDMYNDCGGLYSAAREMVNVSTDVLTFLQADFKAEVLSRAWQINYCLLAWTAFSLLFLLGAVLPILYRSRRHVVRMIAVGSLVQRETTGSREASTHT